MPWNNTSALSLVGAVMCLISVTVNDSFASGGELARTEAGAPGEQSTDPPPAAGASLRTPRSGEIPQLAPGQVLHAGDLLAIAFYEHVEIGRPLDGLDPETAGPALSLFYKRLDLSGEYPVNADGAIVIPRLGALQAAGQTLADVRRDVAAAFEKIVQRPTDVSVAFVKRQPVYVVGLVQNPGSYAFVANMMVIQAVALAGGLPKRDFADSRMPELARQSATLEQLRNKQARLRAEHVVLASSQAGAEVSQPPTDLTALLGPAEAERLFDRARAIMATDEALANTQRGVLQERVSRLGKERGLLKARLETVDQELASRQARLLNTRDLIDQGISRRSRLEELREGIFAVQMKREDIVMAVERMEFELAEAEAAVFKFDTARRASQAERLTTIETEIADTDRQIRAAQISIETIALQQSSANVDPSNLDYQIVRSSGGRTKVIDADETAYLAPGDVVRIIRGHGPATERAPKRGSIASRVAPSADGAAR